MTSLYRGGPVVATLAQRCKELRHRETPAEKTLWGLLRGHRFEGLKFRRQHQFGPYILDFYCTSLALAVEVDGDVHDSADARAADQRRNQALAEAGVLVVRFENAEVLRHPSRVLSYLGQVVAGRRPPEPDPLRG